MLDIQVRTGSPGHFLHVFFPDTPDGPAKGTNHFVVNHGCTSGSVTILRSGGEIVVSASEVGWDGTKFTVSGRIHPIWVSPDLVSQLVKNQTITTAVAEQLLPQERVAPTAHQDGDDRLILRAMGRGLDIQPIRSGQPLDRLFGRQDPIRQCVIRLPNSTERYVLELDSDGVPVLMSNVRSVLQQYLASE